MNNRALWIIGGLTVLVLVVVAWFLLASTTKEPVPATDITLPSAGDTGQENGSSGSAKTILLPTGTGTSIETKDFLIDQETVADPVNAGHYYLGYHEPEGVTDPTATENPPYVVEYLANTHFFIIVLGQEPLGSVRKDMEQYLMTHLGLTRDGMCQLKYQVGVPARVNAQYAGTDLRFSFCPGATVLPE